MSVQNLSPLFEDVQETKIFPDGKTFVDCLPKFPEEEIVAKYQEFKKQEGFNLRQFVLDNFELPVPHANHYQSDINKSAEENIETLWPVLTRKPDEKKGSLIPLPYPYIVPGGRFGEIYYWDSYFTMLGLHASGKTEMIENMVNNFAHLIDTVGYIPNGNRTYYLGRSQPPFYSLMIQLLAKTKGASVLSQYLPQMEKEYLFWMKGQNGLTPDTVAAHHTVRMPGGEMLNRYWDESDTPRPESYREDAELARQSGQTPEILFRHLRAGAESGWDYSSRWFKNPNDFSSIHTTEIVPVDLNCLLWHLETTIADAYQQAGDKNTEKFKRLASARKQAIHRYCWNEPAGYYFDYDWGSKQQKTVISLAGIAPLFFGIAEREQAEKTKRVIKEVLLKEGGVVSSPHITGQQWDAPNGWAPLQWMTITGLENYDLAELAAEIARRWIRLNIRVFNRTGKLMEKYNVIDTHLEAGGGEYDGQDGFGWTNGVLLALIGKYGKPE